MVVYPTRHFRGGGLPSKERIASAHVALASTHYSLVKRYKRADPRAIWHAWRAVEHARSTYKIWFSNYDQMDVVSTILSKVPRFLRGHAGLAYRVVELALVNAKPEGWEPMKPHTRAFLLIRRAEIETKLGKQAFMVEIYYDQARKLIPDITDERQKCRILSAVGFFQFDSFGANRGWELIAAAIGIAHRVSKDQYEKILAEAGKRRMDISLLEMAAGITSGMIQVE